MNKKLFSLSISILLLVLLQTYFKESPRLQQLIIHFTKIPTDEHQHKNLHTIIEESLELVNNKLIADGLLAPELGELSPNASVIDYLSYYIKKGYYYFFNHARPFKFPHKQNRAFFIRNNKQLGVYTVFVPDGISLDTFKQYLKEIYDSKGVEFHIDPDAAVRIAQNPNGGLEGLYFTADELQNFVQGTLPSRIKRLLEKKQIPESRVFSAFLWHLSFPTVGVTLKEPFYPPPYPFLPHYFSLWQLAPKQGKDIRVAVIDTGLAAYEVQNDKSYLKNKSLQPKIIPGEHNFNIVSSYGLDPLEQFTQTIKKYIDLSKYNEEEIEKLAPSWIKQYLIENKDTLVRTYLLKNAQSEYVLNNQLTVAGQDALTSLLTGDEGIKPSNTEIKPPFTIAKLNKPIQSEVILEFLPAPRITSEPITLVAGHGTHIFGLVSAQDIGNGITGIAPQASTFMIKGFNDDGTSDQSTLLAALKKALVHDAQVVNLSLKISNELDMTDQTAQLLERVLKLIPYAVAASGNDGDPRRSGLRSPIESYPARFASVPFDVGAFSYDGKNANIPVFSQYELNIGPLLIAPGFDILSTALIPSQTVDTIYLFLAGTSMAAPIVSGFVALMLAEFQELFTRDQLLKVCYLSTLRLQNTDDWKVKVLLGALDMRTVLLTLHILAYIKQNFKNINFEQMFDHLLAAIQYLLFADVDAYSKKYLSDISFKNNYISYLNVAREHKNELSKEQFLVPHSIDDAVNYIVTILKNVFTQNIDITNERMQKVDQIFKQTTLNLFGDLTPAIQQRVEAKNKIDPYWVQQAKLLKKK